MTIPSVVLAGKVLDDTTVSPGVLGFAVFLAMALLTFLLLRSFVKQLRTVRANEEKRLMAESAASGAPSRSEPTPQQP